MVDKALFKDPPAEYRPVAMWFLNGAVDDDEARRQIREMAEGGVGAIQIAARTGLAIPYLSHRWFQLINLILDEAQRCGLIVWLADEYPYPSGTSGGEVTLRHPEYRAWDMQAARIVAHGGEEVNAVAPRSVLLRACAVPIRGGVPDWSDPIALEDNVGLVQHQQVLFEPTQVYLTTRRYMTNGPRPTLHWRAPSNSIEWEIWLVAASEITDYKFFGSYVDLCNRQATEYFLSTTHERYVAALGQGQFSKLAGFFLDEAHPQNWSWQLPNFFRQTCGYDLVEVLPALWTDIGDRTARVRYDYRQAITELFDQNFMRPVAEWCQKHGVSLSLEVPSTRNVVQRHAHIPGIDPGHEKVGAPLDDILARELPFFRGNLHFPASLAAQSGRRRVLDELFHSTGWSLTLQDMKAMLDRAAARGANLFAFHAFCYTIGGLRKWDAPPSEFDQNPYWPHFPILSAYAGRLAYALSRGRRVAPTAIVDPITSIWTHSTLPGLQQDQIAQRVTQDWTRLMRELAARQRPHDTIDPRLLAEATVEGERVRLGEADYQVIILPSMTNLEHSAWNKLEEFVANGGLVIQCGLLPDEQIEASSDIVPRCRAAFHSGARRGFVAVESLRELLDLLDDQVPIDLTLELEDDDGARHDFLLAQRREGDQDLFFIANSSMREHTCHVSLRAGGSVVTCLDLETGQSKRLAPCAESTSTQPRFELNFAPHGAHLLLVEPDREPRLDKQTTKNPVVEASLDGDWRCEIAGEGLNVLRLDRFHFTIANDPEAVPTMQALSAAPLVVEPKPLVNIFRDVTLSMAAWPGQVEVTPVFGAQPRLGLRLPASVWYAATFAVRVVPARVLLCLEDAAVSGAWDLWINGHRLTSEAFIPKRRWSVATREADLTALLGPGDNDVLLRVSASESWDGLLDAIYLLGDFAVFRDDRGTPVLDRQPATIRWSERYTSGYPFLSGTLRLTRRFSLPAPSGPFRLRLPDGKLMFAGVAQLAINGRELGVRAWATYAWDVPAGLVSPGSTVEITLLITNTLIEQLEGKRYDPLTRRAVSVW